ncbi:MAG: heme lyase CcmF/NrfE family subunit [candidate division KSB1 bacterium]|nr:heme lyase CcmF/NrfE family subunit [candidate division KSB1 bacterium]
MASLIGSSLLWASFLVTGWGAIASVLAAQGQSVRHALSAERAAKATFLFLSLSCAVLVQAFVAHDFSIRYVAEYSSRSMPLFYLVSSLWAGQAGSLLFWAWLLSLYTVIVIRSERRQEDGTMLPAVLATLHVTTLFFLLLITAASNPFEPLDPAPADGRGLNPLLRNPMMVFHPPSLYLGFVGFAVPFAFAIAALATNRLDLAWIRKIRRWTLFAWFFLTLGNLLGAEWAYVELGWGGYWGWDPVENASLLPWITGTAFLHSVVVQERKGLFRVWNFSLIVVTFALTILGTFITRSGVISSVHAFGKSSLGPMFLVFLVLMLTVSFGLLFRRLSTLRASGELRLALSEEWAILLTNVVLSGLALVVFWGTLFPTISEALTGRALTLGAPWFSAMSRPFGLALLLLLALCRAVSWGGTRWRAFLRRLAAPALLAILSVGGGYALGVRHGAALLAYGLSAAVVLAMLLDAYVIARARARTAQVRLTAALRELLGRQRRLYGSYVVHIGVAVMLIGIVGSSTFSRSVTKTVRPGEAIQIGRYTLTFQGLQVNQYRDRTSVAARVSVSNAGRPLGQMVSRKDFYPNYEPVTEVDIRSRLHEDLYLVLASYERDGSATLQAYVNPLTFWLWVGGGLIGVGALLAWLPPRRGRKLKNDQRRES